MKKIAKSLDQQCKNSENGYTSINTIIHDVVTQNPATVNLFWVFVLTIHKHIFVWQRCERDWEELVQVSECDCKNTICEWECTNASLSKTYSRRSERLHVDNCCPELVYWSSFRSTTGTPSCVEMLAACKDCMSRVLPKPCETIDIIIISLCVKP